MGVYMCISTMAAAALGNTISDVMGLGLAHYVEALCLFLGMRPPKLTAEQIDGKACRRVMSYVSMGSSRTTVHRVCISCDFSPMPPEPKKTRVRGQIWFGCGN